MGFFTPMGHKRKPARLSSGTPVTRFNAIWADWFGTHLKFSHAKWSFVIYFLPPPLPFSLTISPHFVSAIPIAIRREGAKITNSSKQTSAQEGKLRLSTSLLFLYIRASASFFRPLSESFGPIGRQVVPSIDCRESELMGPCSIFHSISIGRAVRTCPIRLSICMNCVSVVGTSLVSAVL